SDGVLLYKLFFFFFFFFQAEDGIRDRNVTGVQTCALPICCGREYGVLPLSVADRLLSREELDRAIKRLFDARFRLGMFDPSEREIGRASCRERVEISVVGGSVKKKTRGEEKRERRCRTDKQ